MSTTNAPTTSLASLAPTISSAPEASAGVSVIDIGDPAYEVVGMDFIINNMFDEGKFSTMRKWFRDDADAMLRRVAKHVEQGLYSVISLQLSKHSCVVICATETDPEEWPEDAMVG